MGTKKKAKKAPKRVSRVKKKAPPKPAKKKASKAKKATKRKPASKAKASTRKKPAAKKKTSRSKKTVEARTSAKATKARRSKKKPRTCPIDGSFLTAELHAKVVNLVNRGFFLYQVAEVVGIGRSTLGDWMARGESRLDQIARWEADEHEGRTLTGKKPERDKYANFFVHVKCAESDSEGDAVECIQKAMKKDWRAAAWYLERKNASRYGSKALRVGVGVGSSMGDGEVEGAGDTLLAKLTIMVERKDAAHERASAQK